MTATRPRPIHARPIHARPMHPGPIRRRPRRVRRAVLVCAALIVVAFTSPPALPADAAASHSLIQGSGSSWSANAVNQWIADVQSNGLQVVFTANGSAQGRKDFGYRTNDFAVTEIGFQGVDSVTGEADTPQGREFAYLPIVSGGTSFPYQIKVRGKLVRDLRLSGETIVKIFTNQITDWSDPQITADNNGRALPSLPIIPVVHSEGSGSSAHLTDWFDKAYPDIWRPFNGRSGLTEYYPRKDPAIAQSGSDGVMNFVSSAAANGAIGYDEYSYALGKNYPVVKVQNASGHYALPSQYNVAVALTQAIINQDKSSPDYLLQDLSKVYTFNDPRVYPLSSYSYMVIPIASDDPKMTTAKRQTVADFLYYSICDGQKEMGPIGYSPLPVNLVQAGFEQVGKLKTADLGLDLTARDVSTCNNPTFVAGQPSRNYLAEIAPMPPACDAVGQGPCADGTSTPIASPTTTVPGPGGGGSSGAGATGAGAGAAGSTAGGATAGAGSGAAGAGPATAGGTKGAGTTRTTTAGGPAGASPDGTIAPTDGALVDPAAVDAGSADGAEEIAGGPLVVASAGDVPAQITPYHAAASPTALAPLAIALLAFIVVAPSFLVRAFQRRARSAP